MSSHSLPALFMRGGTSKAIMFDRRDLPAERTEWDPIFLSAMGSPDPAARQLDGMGGGITALSKVCVVSPSSRNDADVDYTFAQVAVKNATVDYKSNCGNMSSAIGPFALEKGMVSAQDGETVVRIYNTNTDKIIHSTFRVQGGRPIYGGDLVIPGVHGSGSPVRLDFIEPGGATTGKLLPTGNAVDVLDVEGFGSIEASLVDAANACVFVRAKDIGLEGTELPEAIETRTDVLNLLAAIRETGSVKMGIAADLDGARKSPVVPYVGFVGEAGDMPIISGEAVRADEMDVNMRIIANGLPHKALPLTVSLCAAVAMRIEGTIPAQATKATSSTAPLRLGMPSGVLTVSADVRSSGKDWDARYGSFYRTTRKLFEGSVCFELED